MRKNLIYIIVLFLSSFCSVAYGLQSDDQPLVSASSSFTFTCNSIAEDAIIQTICQSSHHQEPSSFYRSRNGLGKHFNKEKKFFSFQPACSLVPYSGLSVFINSAIGFYQSYIPQLWRKLLFPKHYFW